MTVRAIGPAVSWSAVIGMIPYRLIRPRVGLIAASMFWSEGLRIEPEVSDPTFAAQKLAAVPVAELDPLITASKLAVRHNADRDLPPLETDRAKVKQILVNLVSNAVKFTPSGHITIAAGHDWRRKQIRIAVTDTGIGIPPHEQERIFEDFRQADSSMARKYGGAGLGLSISRRLAAMLHGSLELSSSPGQGSTFALVLPRAPRPR